MSDCSMQAFMPKQPRMLCTGCPETAKAKDIEQRYERLAQVTGELMRYARIRLGEHWTKEDAKACKAYEDELGALGVSVDG